MSIFTLISAYREQRHELAAAVATGEQLGSVLVLRDLYDAHDLLPGYPIVRYEWYSSERAKRNRMLELAREEFDPKHRDWLLSLDPDERPIGDWNMLPLLLERLDPLEPAFPLLRQELDGSLWVMPCKLFRGSVRRYLHLDVIVQLAGGDTFSLDPWRIDDGSLIPGYPALMHLRSSRADDPRSSDFYSEPEPPPAAIVYRPTSIQGVRYDTAHLPR